MVGSATASCVARAGVARSLALAGARAGPAQAADAKNYDEIYARYLASAPAAVPAPTPLWMADLTTDPRARRVERPRHDPGPREPERHGSADSNVDKTSERERRRCPAGSCATRFGKLLPIVERHEVQRVGRHDADDAS